MTIFTSNRRRRTSAADARVTGVLSEFVYTVTSDLYANALSSGRVTALPRVTLWAPAQDALLWCGSFSDAHVLR